MDAARRTECLSGTRENTLKVIVDWVNDQASEQNILWVYGLAGSGKSTLSTTIANIFRESSQLGAFIFFNRDVTERSDPTSVIRTLAHQLGSSSANIGGAICAVIVRNSNILISPLAYQFDKLILDPLSNVSTPSRTIVIVLDVLDECGKADDREAFLTVLAHNFAHLPRTIRTIITSRTEIDICTAFESQHHIMAHELDIASSVNSDDILLYFRHRVALLQARNKHLRLDVGWPGEDVLGQLTQRASGLFVWASTASKFIHGFNPKK
ncbi:hypothetical protein PILCRDRAFT_425318 [Piloderma croceum F 1598]|uniref:Nephrocystin 3-like N-terminal domain-containing protein n=1 Tax=Piloderma croceum (strain F 1598) TaxID=765440 RepID=A0A0C3C1J5_PILCF|nr:hypothetical protein PILCRDRAFT_425318 [Piloderma croceum F 1598]